MERALADGARLATGGPVNPVLPTEELAKGNFVQPTILSHVPVDSQAWTEEIFGQCQLTRPGKCLDLRLSARVFVITWTLVVGTGNWQG